MTQAEVEAALHVQRKIRECRIRLQSALTIEERLECMHTLKRYKRLFTKIIGE